MPNKHQRKQSPPKKLLWAEDDPEHLKRVVDELNLTGFHVTITKNCIETLRLVRKHKGAFDLVILDMLMPYGRGWKEDKVRPYHGMDLANVILREFPNLPLAACTFLEDDTYVTQWFSRHGLGCFRKSCLYRADMIAQEIRQVLAGRRKTKKKPKCFIVHGHDEKELSELKVFIQKNLKFGEPVILRDSPSLGRTIIEKLGYIADMIDIAFILLTPDDVVRTKGKRTANMRRARQNVIFELGYFYAKLLRGRVVLLYKGVLELPSDIAGIVYVDITNGIETAHETIRKELGDWL